MSFLGNALGSLGVTKYVVKGDPKNESEFNSKFRKVVGQDSTGTAILSDDPSDFGITWKEVSDQMKIEEQKFNSQAYSRKREAEYPSIQECVHAILDDQLDALQAKRAEIKTKYPKG